MNASVPGPVVVSMPILKQEYEQETGRAVPEAISTDTKIIPLRLQRYLQRGQSVDDAFRLAVDAAGPGPARRDRGVGPPLGRDQTRLGGGGQWAQQS